MKPEDDSISMLDKWKQFKENVESLRFMMVIEEFSKNVWKVKENGKLRGSKISWAASDNVCLNFFSSVSVKKDFIWHMELRYNESNLMRGSYWQDSNSSYRMVIRHPGKERNLFLYFSDMHWVFKVAFYLKYQLGIKKSLPKFAKKVDLAAVWKVKTYKEPLLEKINRFVEKFKGLSREQFEERREEFGEMGTLKEQERVVEGRGDLAQIRETVADNGKQITFQIFDFQVAGLLVIDKGLMDPRGVVPMRDYGVYDLKERIEERVKAGGTSEGQDRPGQGGEAEAGSQEAGNYTDFRRQMTIEKDIRKVKQLRNAKLLNSQMSETQTNKPIETFQTPDPGAQKINNNVSLGLYSDDEEEEVVSKYNNVERDSSSKRIHRFNIGRTKEKSEVAQVDNSVGHKSEMGVGKRGRRQMGRVSQSGRVNNRSRRRQRGKQTFMFETGTMQGSNSKLQSGQGGGSIFEQIEEVSMKLTQVISEKAQSENLNNSKKKAAKSHVPFKFNKYRPRVMVESDEEIPIFEIPDLKKVKPESQQEESVVGKEEQSLKSKQTFRASKFSIFGDEDDGFRGRKSKQHGKRKIRGQSEVVSRRDRKFRRQNSRFGSFSRLGSIYNLSVDSAPNQSFPTQIFLDPTEKKRDRLKRKRGPAKSAKKSSQRNMKVENNKYEELEAEARKLEIFDEKYGYVKHLGVHLKACGGEISSSPVFVIQYEQKADFFAYENSRARKQSENTLREIIKIQHLPGKDFEYFAVDSLVKAFLPLQLVDTAGDQTGDKKGKKGKKSRWGRELETVKEEEMESSQGKLGMIDQASSIGGQLEGFKDVGGVGGQLNKSLRNEGALGRDWMVQKKYLQMKRKKPKNDTKTLGYYGGHQQKRDHGQPVMREFQLDLVQLKQRLLDEDSTVIDSEGRFQGQPDFGSEGMFIMIRSISQPLRYVTLDVDQEEKFDKTKFGLPRMNTKDMVGDSMRGIGDSTQNNTSVGGFGGQGMKMKNSRHSRQNMGAGKLSRHSAKQLDRGHEGRSTQHTDGVIFDNFNNQNPEDLIPPDQSAGKSTGVFANSNTQYGTDDRDNSKERSQNSHLDSRTTGDISLRTMGAKESGLINDSKYQTDLERMLPSQSVMTLQTTQSQQLGIINQQVMINPFDMDLRFMRSSGQVFRRLGEGDDRFALNLLNLPLGAGLSRDYSLVGLVRHLAGGKQAFVSWSPERPMKVVSLPCLVQYEKFKLDFKIFEFGVKLSVDLLAEFRTQFETKLRSMWGHFNNLLTSLNRISRRLNKTFQLPCAKVDETWILCGTPIEYEELLKHNRQYLNKPSKDMEEQLAHIYYHRVQLLKSKTNLRRDSVRDSELRKIRKKRPKTKVVRMSEIEPEYLVFKRRPVWESLRRQVRRLLRRVFPNEKRQELLEQRVELLLDLLSDFQSQTEKYTMYFFMIAKTILQKMGRNYFGLGLEDLRVAVMSLAGGFFEQQMEDGALLNVIHIVLKSATICMFDRSVLDEERKLVGKVEEFEKLRDEEVTYQNERFEEMVKQHLIKREGSSMGRSDMRGGGSEFMKEGRGLLAGGGYEQDAKIAQLRLKNRREVTRVHAHCEASLQSGYLELVRRWRLRDVNMRLENSPWMLRIKEQNFSSRMTADLKKFHASAFYIFQDWFVHQMVRFCFGGRQRDQPRNLTHQRRTKHQTMREKQAGLVSGLGTWPLTISFDSGRLQSEVSFNIVHNLVFSVVKEEGSKGVFSWVTSKVKSMFSKKQRAVIQEIGLSGKDIHTQLKSIQSGILRDNLSLQSLFKTFPKKFAFTDLFYNQVNLDVVKPVSYILRIETRIRAGLRGKSHHLRTFYRVRVGDDEALNNEGNRYFLKSTGSDLWGLKAKRCGRAGCHRERPDGVEIEVKSGEQIRKRLGVSNREDLRIPNDIGEVEHSSLGKLLEDYEREDRDIGLFRGLDGLENLKHKNYDQIHRKRAQLLKLTKNREKYEREYFIGRLEEHQRKGSQNSKYDKTDSLDRSFKLLPSDGLILLRNPNLPSPSAMTVEVVIVEQFKGNSNEPARILVQDELGLGQMQFNEKRLWVYEMEGGLALEVESCLFLPVGSGKRELQRAMDASRLAEIDKRDRNQKKRQRLRARHQREEKVLGEELDLSLEEDMYDAEAMAEENGEQVAETKIKWPGGSGGGERNRSSSHGNTNNNNANNAVNNGNRADIGERGPEMPPDRGPITVEMTGGNGPQRKFKRTGTLGQDSLNNLISKQGNRRTVGSFGRMSNLDVSGSILGSEEERELDNLIENLEGQVLEEEEPMPNTGSNRFDFTGFEPAKEKRPIMSEVLSKEEIERRQRMVRFGLIEREFKDSKVEKRLKLLERNTVDFVNHNLGWLKYLSEMFGTDEDCGVLKDQIGFLTKKMNKSRRRSVQSLKDRKDKRFSMSRDCWHRLGQAILGEVTIPFGPSTFSLSETLFKDESSNTGDIKRIRDIFKRKFYLFDQLVLKNLRITSDHVFLGRAELFTVQVYQLILRSKGSYLDFLFDYFHWLDFAFAGQGAFVHRDYVSRLIAALLVLNGVPNTLQFVDLNLGGFLGTRSEEALDVYEYYKYLQPIRREKRVNNRRKKLLQWIRFKENREMLPDVMRSQRGSSYNLSNQSLHSRNSSHLGSSRSRSASAFNRGPGSTLSNSMKSVISARSSRSKSLSEFSIKYRSKNKRRRNKKFACFHCNEEISAKETNDGLYRRIYRPGSEGFVESLPARGRLLSAFIIVSDTKKVKMDLINEEVSNVNSGTGRKDMGQRGRKFSRKSHNSSGMHENSRSFISNKHKSSAKKLNRQTQRNSKHPHEVIDVSQDFNTLLEQSSLYLGRQEVPLTDKFGELFTINSLLSHRAIRPGQYNKLVVLDNRIRGRFYTLEFGQKQKFEKIHSYRLAQLRLAFPKEFLLHLCFSNRLMASLYRGALKST